MGGGLWEGGGWAGWSGVGGEWDNCNSIINKYIKKKKKKEKDYVIIRAHKEEMECLTC